MKDEGEWLEEDYRGKVVRAQSKTASSGPLRISALWRRGTMRPFRQTFDGIGEV